MIRSEILSRIEAERARHIDLSGSEMDVRNTPNEWAAIAAHYLTEEVRRGSNIPDRTSFEDSFIKAAAVILAALEYAPVMQDMGHLRGDITEPSTLAQTLARLS